MSIGVDAARDSHAKPPSSASLASPLSHANRKQSSTVKHFKSRAKLFPVPHGSATIGTCFSFSLNGFSFLASTYPCTASRNVPSPPSTNIASGGASSSSPKTHSRTISRQSPSHFVALSVIFTIEYFSHSLLKVSNSFFPLFVLIFTP